MGVTISHHETHPSERFRDGFRYWADFEPTPFAEGVARYAYRGTYHGTGPRNRQKCVVKLFKEKYDRSLESWSPDLLAHAKAAELAVKFSSRAKASKTLRFQEPVITTMDKVSRYMLFGVAPACVPSQNESENIIGSDYVSLEDFIYGKWEKFNSNTGWVCSHSSLIPAFSHFTYAFTEGDLLVCDIQGVRKNEEYVLTDPAICSRDQRFGITDTGSIGMSQFFKSHVCSRLCDGLLLPEEADITTTSKVQRHTRYSFQITPEQKKLNTIFKNRHDLPAVQAF